MILIQPSRCTDSLPEDLERDHLVAEPKMDGSRYVFYIGGDPYERQPKNALLSRRISVKDNKHVDRTANCPHFADVDYPDLSGTILDGEIMAEDFPATNSIMNSSPALAIQKQKELGWLNYHVFDVMFFRGKDVRGLPLEKRRKIVLAICERINNVYVKPIEQRKGNISQYFQEIINAGGEGLIVKDLRQGYGRGWCKLKRSFDVSCIISGYKAGNGKYATSIGSLALSVFHNGSLVEVGFASGFDDALRAEMAKDFSRFKGKVVDVFAHELSKPSKESVIGRIRHPTYHRLRDDMNQEDCTSLKLQEDLKAGKVRSSRFKRED